MREEEFAKGRQDAPLSFRALRRVADGRDPWHTDTLQRTVSKNGQAWRLLAGRASEVFQRLCSPG
jgi:hypothetical protein